MILSFLFFAFLAYLVFRLVFNFIIPIYKTTKKVRRTFREMNEQMNRQHNGNTPHQKQPGTEPQATKKSSSGDYIDFEEVKD